MHKSPIAPNIQNNLPNGKYHLRNTFLYNELLAFLPKEMLAAKNQLGTNVTCKGDFYISAAGYLCYRTSSGPAGLAYIYRAATLTWSEIV